MGLDAMLVTELSRWGRSTTDLLATLKELEARRVSVVALNGVTFDRRIGRGTEAADAPPRFPEQEPVHVLPGPPRRATTSREQTEVRRRSPTNWVDPVSAGEWRRKASETSLTHNAHDRNFACSGGMFIGAAVCLADTKGSARFVRWHLSR
jgi:Resolvase, N terminal domain